MTKTRNSKGTDVPRLRRYLWRHLHDASQRDLAEGECSYRWFWVNVLTHSRQKIMSFCLRIWSVVVFLGVADVHFTTTSALAAPAFVLCLASSDQSCWFWQHTGNQASDHSASRNRPISDPRMRSGGLGLKLLKLHSTKRQRPEVPTKISGQEPLRNLQRKCRTLNVLSHYDSFRQTERSCHDGNGWWSFPCIT